MSSAHVQRPAYAHLGTAIQIACEEATRTGRHHAVLREGRCYVVRPVVAVAYGEPRRSQFDVFSELCSQGWDPDEAARAAGGTGRP